MAFNKAKLQYKKQVCVDLLYDNHKIGKYFLDFIVENKIIVELKTVFSVSLSRCKTGFGIFEISKVAIGNFSKF